MIHTHINIIYIHIKTNKLLKPDSFYEEMQQKKKEINKNVYIFRSFIFILVNKFIICDLFLLNSFLIKGKNKQNKK